VPEVIVHLIVAVASTKLQWKVISAEADNCSWRLNGDRVLWTSS